MAPFNECAIEGRRDPMVLKYQEQESTARGSVPDAPIDNAYIVGCSGFIYTGASIVSEETRPPSAALIVSAGPTPFKILVKGQELLTRAAVIPPFLARGLDARAVPLVCFHITPSSPLYVEFRALAHGRVVLLERAFFQSLDAPLHALYHGRLAPARAAEIYDQALRIPFQHLTPDSKPDPRQQRIRQLLESGRDLTLTDLARELGTSYFWASRLMTEVFGMSLRDYKSWQKLQRVFHLLHSKHSITEVAHAAGFTDSAHLSRTYQRWFGQPPSYSRNRNN
ncbi:MAG: AraC family transcriptional regulator, partial [Marinobacter sp.]